MYSHCLTDMQPLWWDRFLHGNSEKHIREPLILPQQTRINYQHDPKVILKELPKSAYWWFSGPVWCPLGRLWGPWGALVAETDPKAIRKTARSSQKCRCVVPRASRKGCCCLCLFFFLLLCPTLFLWVCLGVVLGLGLGLGRHAGEVTRRVLGYIYIYIYIYINTYTYIYICTYI